MGSENIVLEEEIDANYEPSEEEILNYAKWIGMDLPAEKDLLWIAREGLIAPLPSDWKPCCTGQDEIYYFNFATGESLWEHPCDAAYRELYLQEKKRLASRNRQLQASRMYPAEKIASNQKFIKTSDSDNVVLEEEIDANYEPSDEEILNYAKWLGMDLPAEKDLLWIAREALIAPLPADWKPCCTNEDQIYYFNFATGESLWDHPCDAAYRELYLQEKKRLSSRNHPNKQPPSEATSHHPQEDHIISPKEKIQQTGGGKESRLRSIVTPFLHSLRPKNSSHPSLKSNSPRLFFKSGK